MFIAVRVFLNFFFYRVIRQRNEIEPSSADYKRPNNWIISYIYSVGRNNTKRLISFHWELLSLRDSFRRFRFVGRALSPNCFPTRWKRKYNYRWFDDRDRCRGCSIKMRRFTQCRNYNLWAQGRLKF